MSIKSKMVYALPFMFILLAFCTKVARADDDDDDVLGELMIDMLTGVAVAACQSNAVCNGILSIVTVTLFIATLIAWCIGGCQCETPTRRDMRRAGGMGLGYGIGRSIF
jgi:hypothetical protein